MKAEISNYGYRQSDRYSGVYQQQGRMLTDRDWNDFAEIVKHRLDAALRRVVESGAPRGGGILDLDAITEASDGPYSAKTRTDGGWAVVDGIVARLLPENTENDFGYDNQADFPNPPKLIDDMPTFLYVDVWERPVLWLEDDELRDLALHGADTCFRSQTMAQIKYCRAVGGAPLTGECDDPDKNPQIGTARIGLELRSENDTADNCDPCATDIRVDGGIGNYLFRLEVHDVTYDGASGDPTEITLKWASDNAGTPYAIGETPVDFRAGGYVYEYFSDITEKSLGVHLVPAADVPAAGVLQAAFSKDPPHEFVRRWDGACTLQRDNGQWRLADDGDSKPNIDRGIPLSTSSAAGDHGHVAFDGTGVTINLLALTLELTLADDRFVRGDFWLALARQRADESDLIKILSDDHRPIGVLHHYLTLGLFDGQSKIVGLDDEDRRRFTFPPLTDITARDVGYETDCASGLFDDTHDTVEKALNQICAIDAGHIGVSISCDSSVYKGVPADQLNTVEDALELLCNVRADQIGFDADPGCDFLENTDNVSDALNALCQRQSGGGCRVTVGDGGEFKDIAGAIKTLLGRKENHICLCLLPGNHPIPRGFQVEESDASISIVGCGRHTTRIILENKPFVLRLRDFSLRDVGVMMADKVSGLVVKADTLSITSCAVVGMVEKQPLLQLDAMDRLHIADNIVEAIDPNAFDRPRIDLQPFGALADLFVFGDRDEFRIKARDAMRVVAGRATETRISAAEDAEKAMRNERISNPRLLSQRQFDSYLRVFAVLKSATLDEDALVAGLEHVRFAALEAGHVTAVLIMTARADTLVDNNDVAGIVAFFGMPGTEGLTEGEIKLVRSRVRGDENLTFDSTERTLNMRNNQMTRLVVGEAVIHALRKLADGGQWTLPLMFRNAMLSDNVLTWPDNHFLAFHHSHSATRFDLQRVDHVGFVVGKSAVYMGCSADNDVRLFNCTRGRVETATLGLNIVLQ